MELDLSCFDRDFNRINLMIESQLAKNKQQREMLNEEISMFIEENKQDIIDEMILEQVRRDQWNKQYSFLLSELGYEVVPEEDVQKRLNESFMGDLAIDLFFTGAPAVIRSAGVIGSLASFGVSAAAAEGIAKMIAGGGALYYIYYAYQAHEEGETLNMIFHIFNALLSLEQAAIPFVSDAIAAAGRLFVRMLGGFFKVLFAPVKIFKNIAGQVASRGATIASEKLGIEACEKIAAYFGKNETVLTNGAKAMDSIAAGGAKAAKQLDDLLTPILNKSDELKSLPGVAPALNKLEQILAITSREFGPAAAETAEALSKSIAKGVDAGKAASALEKNKKVLEAIEEVLQLAAPGKPLANADILAGITVKELNATKSALLKVGQEGTEQLGKVAGQVISAEMKAGVNALKATSGGGVIVDDIARNLTNNMQATVKTALKDAGMFTRAGGGGRSYLYQASRSPKFVASADGVLQVSIPNLSIFGANKGKTMAVDEGIQVLQKIYSKEFGTEFGEIFYKSMVSGITSAPKYKSMMTAITTVAEAEAPGVASWMSKNFWKVVASDSAGFVKTLDAFRTASTGTIAVGSTPFKTGLSAALMEAGKNAQATMTFWRGLTQMASGAATAGTKAFDPRSGAQKRMAKRKAAAPDPVKSTIKTRADGTAGTTPGIKSSAVGATKTKAPEINLKDLA